MDTDPASPLPRSVVCSTEEECGHLAKMLREWELWWKARWSSLDFFLFGSPVSKPGLGLGRKKEKKPKKEQSLLPPAPEKRVSDPGSANSMAHTPPGGGHVSVQPTWEILHGTGSRGFLLVVGFFLFCFILFRKVLTFFKRLYSIYSYYKILAIFPMLYNTSL